MVPVSVPGCAGVGLLQHDFDLLAAGLIQDAGEGGIAVEVDGEALEGAFDRRVAVVTDRGDMAAVEVAHDHRLDADR